MIEFIVSVPFWVWLLAIAVEMLLIHVTAQLALQRGRLGGLAEADQSTRRKEKTQFALGKIEGVRECADWLRHNGHADESKNMLRLLAPSTSN